MFLKFLFSKPLRAKTDENSSILFKIICSVLLIITATSVMAMVHQPKYILRFTMAISLLWVISLVLLFALKKQNSRIIAVIYISFLLLMILGFSFTGGGIKAHGIRLLPIVVLFSGLTIGRKSMWVFAILASFGGLLLVLASYLDLLPLKGPIGQTPFSYWIYSVSGIFLFCYIENLSVGRFNKTVDQLKQQLSLRKQSEEKYKVIFESFQDIYYQTDMTGIVTIVTPSIKQRAGYNPKEVIGNNVADFYHQTDKRNDFMKLLLEKGSVHNYELELVTKDGKIKNVLVSSHILYDSNGAPITIEGTLHDITRRKKDENLLKEQNEKLMQIAHLQSHIVRKPVANILGIIDLLDIENPNDPNNLELIPKLETASKELDTIIKEIVQNTKGIREIVKANTVKNESDT
ncbi:MAG: PAS domain-containing protein [Flavobacterium sp.]|uniref:PAS domain-containing protein n=1 Tax=Flavobacterium sp. TaxID=239 RepID=UPI00326343BF